MLLRLFVVCAQAWEHPPSLSSTPPPEKLWHWAASHHFRVLLLRRTCRCGRQLDPFGHHHCENGLTWSGASRALVVTRRCKERAYPELVCPRSRAKLVVLVEEVGGRRLEETVTFLRLLAVARARSERASMSRIAEQAWRMRGGMLWSSAPMLAEMRSYP